MDIVKLIAIYVVVIVVVVGGAIYLPKKVKEHDEALVAKTTEVIIKNKILGECMAPEKYEELIMNAKKDSAYWVGRYQAEIAKAADSLLLAIRKREEEAYRIKRLGVNKDGTDTKQSH